MVKMRKRKTITTLGENGIRKTHDDESCSLLIFHFSTMAQAFRYWGVAQLAEWLTKQCVYIAQCSVQKRSTFICTRSMYIQQSRASYKSSRKVGISVCTTLEIICVPISCICAHSQSTCTSAMPNCSLTYAVQIYLIIKLLPIYYS